MNNAMAYFNAQDDEALKEAAKEILEHPDFEKQFIRLMKDHESGFFGTPLYSALC